MYPYKIKDDYGNVFVFSHLENGIPLYRGSRGCKLISDVDKYEVVELKA